ncbi:MAG: hypothetical protein JSW70_03865 [Syntrophobacterales bacterium]|nr:MAG: hypothetical protein JSW70_03865 [Syntrophobacterales bacterium]
MIHGDESHYAGKHGAQKQLDQAIADAIRKRSVKGKLSCAAAFHIAEEVSVEPSEVGRTLDLLEVKIIKCQLGLFGHERGKHLIVKAAEAVPPALERALRASLVDERLPCATAWEIAKRFDLPKMGITSACETLNIRIGQCQLGSF